MADLLAFGDVLDAFRTQLAARGNLAGVVIVTGQAGLVDAREVIEFIGVDMDRERIAMANQRLETGTIRGRVEITRPNTASDQSLNTAPKDARDRLIVILKEIEQQLITDETINSSCEHADFGPSVSYEDLVTDTGHLAQAEFTVEYEAHLTAP